LWQFVRRLNRDGHTIVLTTHYLEEAEQHCGRIAMLKAGRVVALDTTRNLLAALSGLELVVRQTDGELTRIKLKDYGELEAALLRLRQAGVQIHEIELHPPDLEDVFLRLTGRPS
jgi:ABC-2 type transport system ATP-binding protein